MSIHRLFILFWESLIKGVKGLNLQRRSTFLISKWERINIYIKKTMKCKSTDKSALTNQEPIS